MTTGFAGMASRGRLTVLSALLLFAGCDDGGSVSTASDGVLLQCGEDVLTMQDVVGKIPVGMEPADSAALFQLIVDNWVKTKVLSNLAERKLPDLSEIDSKVADYRNLLIISEYIDEMKKGKDFKVSKDSIRHFYNRFKGNMLTETPLVKGIYVKVSADVANIGAIKELVFCGSDECIDRLEKTLAGETIQYDYFINDWVDWQTIADRIPYRFFDPDAFLRSTNNFETTYNGSAYILHIAEYLPSGSEPPYEFAAVQIGELMERANIKKFEESLVRAMVIKALNDGELVAEGYDPVNRRIDANFAQTVTDTIGSLNRANDN